VVVATTPLDVATDVVGVVDVTAVAVVVVAAEVDVVVTDAVVVVVDVDFELQDVNSSEAITTTDRDTRIIPLFMQTPFSLITYFRMFSNTIIHDRLVKPLTPITPRAPSREGTSTTLS
jgi:hypothetical protein